MRILLLLSLLLVIGCDEVVSEVKGKTYYEVRQASCNYVGVCYGCGLSFSGKFECSLGFHSMCDGRHWIEAEMVPIIYTYKSGSIKESNRTIRYKSLSDCE